MMKPRCPEKSVVNRFQSRSGLAFLDLPDWLWQRFAVTVNCRWSALPPYTHELFMNWTLGRLQLCITGLKKKYAKISSWQRVGSTADRRPRRTDPVSGEDLRQFSCGVSLPSLARYAYEWYDSDTDSIQGDSLRIFPWISLLDWARRSNRRYW
jgi:hypothetical protein